MDIIRNFIKITGISGASELPTSITGPITQYSENETIFIPENSPGIQSIFQIILNVEITSNRTVNTNVGTIVVLDGVKKYKIIYTGNENSSKANFLDIEVPYNTFIELPAGASVSSARVYVLDAYFGLLDDRKIYSHIVYMACFEITLNSSKQDMVRKVNDIIPIPFPDSPEKD